MIMRHEYFACDPCDVRSIADTLAGLSRATAGSGSHWLALVDTAFDHGRPPLQWSRTRVPLYGPGRLAALRHVSPVLCELDAEHPEVLRNEAARLAMHAAERPMLAFLRTRRSADEQAQRMSGALEVRTDDAECYVLRMADTRVSAALPQALDANHWRRLTCGIDQWLIVGREGRLLDLVLPGPCTATDDSMASIELSAAELARLLDAGWPDALAQALHEHFEDLLPEGSRAAFHARLVDLCELARRHRIERFPFVVSLAVAELSTRGALRHDPRFAAWLRERRWTDETFNDSLTELVGEIAP